MTTAATTSPANGGVTSSGHAAADGADEQRPGEAQPAPLALLLGRRGARQGQHRRRRRAPRAVPGARARPARAAGGAGGRAPSGGRATGRKTRTRQSSRVAAGDGQGGPDLALGGPGELDREAGAPEGVQVGRAHLPPVGEPVDQLGPPEVHGVRPRGGARARAWPPPATPCSRSARARARRAGWPRSPGRRGCRCGRTSPRRSGAGPGWVAGSCGVPAAVGNGAGPAAAAGRRVEGELVDVPAGAGGRGAGTRRVVPGRGLHDVRARRRA